MRRSPELAPLSRDHHQALSAAQRLRRAGDASVATEAFLSFWEAHGSRHFRVEEEVLLPGWFEADRAADHGVAARVVADHLAVRVEVRRMRRAAASLEALRELGGLLEGHVRFEERELFPLIEDGLAPDAIARLGVEIASAESEG